jgi:general secretion pathway protein N
MRAEDIGARTWLYAGLAGWALCVWVLAMFGMGGSIDPLDDDPSLRQPLPGPGAPGPERLGPLTRYGDIAARPLFTDNRRPQPFVIDPMGEAEAAGNDFDYVLSSVLRAPGLQMVILQPAEGGEPVRVKLGAAPDSAPGWVLQSVEARSAVFAGPDGERSLELRVFDGTGGQAPTPMAMPAPGADADQSAAGGADADMGAPPDRSAGSQPTGRPGADADAPPEAARTAAQQAEQQQAAREQVEIIRQRIEERRARLNQERRSRPAQPANENQ